MKTKTRNIFIMLIMAVLCSVIALFIPKTENRVSAATAAETNVFEMVDAGSVRYGNDKPGLRFIVKMTEDVKTHLVDSGAKLGFVVSRSDKFEGITEDYLNQVTPQLTFEAITVDEATFYAGEKELTGYWCANVVINMGEKDTREAFLSRDYSAVAYYKLGDAAEVYTENVATRSIQLVASRAMLLNEPNYDKVAETYPELGTDAIPYFVEQNTYDSLVSKVKEGKTFDGEYFKLTEDIAVAEEVSADTFAGSFTQSDYKVYNFDTLYTVNHKVTDVYSVNENVALTDKVTTEAFAVNYTVADANGEAVAVNGNGFVPAAEGNYTVTAQAKNFPTSSFTVEVANNPYANAIIWDGTDTSALTWALDKNAVKPEISFDSAKGFDAQSNGSLVMKMTPCTGWVYTKLNLQYSDEYYAQMIEDGYTSFAIRMMVEDGIETKPTEDWSFQLWESYTLSNASLYGQDGTLLRAGSKCVPLATNIYSFGTWIEVVVPISELSNNQETNSLMGFKLFRNKPSSDYTVYVDNVYMVKDEALNERALTEKDLGCEVEVASLFSADTDLEIVDQTLTQNGQSLTATDGKFTLSEQGYYGITARARNRYGLGKASVVTAISGDSVVVQDCLQADDIAVPTVYKVNTTTTNGTATVTHDGTYLMLQAIQQSLSYFNIAVKVSASIEYYEYLKEQGFNYITVKVGSASSNGGGQVYMTAGNLKATHKNSMKNPNGELQYYKDGALTAHTGYLGSWTKNVWVDREVSLSIDTFIEMCEAGEEMVNILTVGFYSSSENQDVTLRFSGVYATKTGTVA